MLEAFKEYLDKSNFSKNTIDSYFFAVNQFYQQYDVVNKKNLKAFKIWMIENYKPKTVNLRLRAINCYLDFIKKKFETTICENSAKNIFRECD